MGRDILGTMREGLHETGTRGQKAAEAIAERVEDVLEDAGREGRRIRRELSRRWKAVDRAGRDNAFVMALGALGVGILIGWLVARDRD
jgi:ElaB/YqjD/DUF883 family membrane-anchored ribosome-binding protein